MTYREFYDLVPSSGASTRLHPPEELWYQEYFLGSGQSLYPTENTGNDTLSFLSAGYYPSGPLDGVKTTQVMICWEEPV